MPRFDTSPIVYWLLIYGLSWGLLWLAVWASLNRRVFLMSMLGLLFLLRLPSIVFDYEINPDESQMITQALTLRQDPVYFQSVDGTTGGPLDSYFLILPSLLGLPFDYITAHLTAFFLISVCLWLLFRTARLWFGEPAARLALLPLIFVLGLTQNGDFLHYNSELIPLVLLSLSYYLYAILLTQDQPRVGQIALIGLLLGMVPFGKLQAVPLAATVGLFVAMSILTRWNLTLSAKAGRIAALGAGGLAFPCLFVAFMWFNGMYADFETFYIVGNLRYASDTNQLQSILSLPEFLQKSGSFDWYTKLSIGVWLIGLVIAIRHRTQLSRNTWERLGFITTLLIATLFSITRTGSGYLHYLFFLTGPLLLGSAYGWEQISRHFASWRWVGAAAAAVILGLFGVQTIQDYRNSIPINPYPSEWQNGWAVQQSPVSKEIVKYAKPGEKLVVWGWRCDYYVQAQMPQGVAENHTIRSGYDHPLQATYQQRYVRNFMRSFPPVFVDAVGSQNLWMTDRKTQGHELIKPLDKFVAAHYRYMGLVNDTRIYVRLDRLTPEKRTLASNQR
jgi:hypothetical protein